MYKKIIDFQKHEIVKNQNILNKQDIKKAENKKGGNIDNMNTIKNIINDLFKLDANFNYYDIKKKSLTNKILFIISNIILTTLLFVIVYNLIYFNHNNTINFNSIFLSILLYILYRLITILEKNISNNNNSIYNVDIYIQNLYDYITSTDLSIEKKMNY